MLSHTALAALIEAHGYWLLALVIGMENAGIPLPGETMLLAVAVYAATTHRLDITWVIGAAIIGAIIGDNAGYWLGRRVGLRLLRRYGRRIGLTEPRLKLGQYLFLRHGGKVVFFGRFAALLRTLAALLAGINRMPWWRFFLCNAAGAVVWAGAFGFGAYLLGNAVQRLAGPLGFAVLLAAIVGGIVALRFARRHEAVLLDKAERALPGESWNV